MCGRFTLHASAQDVLEAFGVADGPALGARYNIAPSQAVAAVRQTPDSGRRRLDLLRWGLVPSWAKDLKIGYKMINARAETVADKASFRVALRRRRCLIPADGFYEWRRAGDAKQPYLIRRHDRRPFAFAGLWERWQGPDGDAVESCTIITTTPNELMARIHHRMPVILAPGDHELWLDTAVQDANRVRPLLRPCSPADWTAHPVSTRVNRPANDDARLLEPVDV